MKKIDSLNSAFLSLAIASLVTISSGAYAIDIYQCSFTVKPEDRAAETVTGHLLPAEIRSVASRQSANQRARVLGLPFVVGNARWPSGSVSGTPSAQGPNRICVFIVDKNDDNEPWKCENSGTSPIVLQVEGQDDDNWTRAAITCVLNPDDLDRD